MSKLEDIKGLVFDVDGVFTDGGIFCDLSGELFRTFDSKDGFAMRMASMYDYNLGIITGGRSASIRARFRTCGVKDEDVYLGSRHKVEDLDKFCNRHNLEYKDLLYVGDDIPDIEVMNLVGISACPCDAVEEVKEIAKIVSTYPGGKGCVREIIEMVLKAQGRWKFDAMIYKSRF